MPPAYLFDDSAAKDDGEATVPMPDAVPVRAQPQPQNIFFTDEDDGHVEPFGFFGDGTQEETTFFPTEPEEEPDASDAAAPDGYPHEDYEQQQVFFPTQQDDAQLYNPPQEEDNFAKPTLYPESVETEGDAGDEYEPPMVFPDRGEDDIQPPTIFPEDEEDMPPPMIFPDDEEEGYSPAPVSPDRNEYFDDGADNQGVMDRSGQTFFSRTGDQIKKVIGVIRGSANNNIRSGKADAPMRNLSRISRSSIAVMSALSVSSCEISCLSGLCISSVGRLLSVGRLPSVSGSLSGESAGISATAGSPGGGEWRMAACALRCISITRMAASRCIWAKLSNCCIQSPHSCVIPHAAL